MECFNYSIIVTFIFGKSLYTDCREADWLLNTSTTQWTITANGGSSFVLRVGTAGQVGSDATNATERYGVRPVVYLKSNVLISGGNGSVSNPYTLTKGKEITDNPGANGAIVTDASGNERYAGSNPNNYVCFGTDATTCSGKQLWRIIGIVDGSLKLISTEYYSRSISFNTSYNNNWSESKLNAELHSNVYNNTEWISSSAQKSWLLNNKWRLSGINSNYTLSNFETAEKNSGYTTSNYIGIMTIIDYLYGSLNTSQCASSTRLDRDPFCGTENWLLASGDWTLTFLKNNQGELWHTYPNGTVAYKSAASNSGARPVIYLDSNVKIVDGDGTESSPYILSK